jgi:hypothetical protein
VSDDARQKILARRARFVAAAVAGIGALACTPNPETPPQPCLSQPMPQNEPDAGVADFEDPEPPPEADPQVCLSVQPDEPQDEPRPQPCLSPLPPPKDAGTT